MSKLFGAVADAITIHKAGKFANLLPVVYMGTINPTGFGNPSKGTIISKVDASGNGHWLYIQNTSGGQLVFQVSRAGVNAQAVAAFPATLFNNEWKCVLGSYQANDGGPRLFFGTHNAALKEMSYSSRADGSGAVTDVTANALVLGNSPVAGGSAWQGRLGDLRVLSGVPALSELQRLFLNPRVLTLAGGVSVVGLWPLEDVTAGQAQDFSAGPANAVSVAGTQRDRSIGLETQGGCI